MKVLLNINKCYSLRLIFSAAIVGTTLIPFFPDSSFRRLWRVWCVVVAGLLGQSCQQKDLLWIDDDGDCVNVRFEWTDLPDVRPDGMTLYFFPVDARSQIWRFDIAGRDGGPVELPQGTYRLLAHNNDLPRIDFTHIDSFYDFSATVRSRNDSLVYAPGMLYNGVVEFVRVSSRGVEYTCPDGSVAESSEGIVSCHPASLCSCYTIEVHGVSGMEYMKAAYATLDGLARSMRLFDEFSYGGPVCVMTDLVADDAGNNLKGEFHSFGISPGTLEFHLTVTIVRDDGKAFAKRFDVTQQVMNCSDLKNVLIIVEDIEIPGDVEPPTSGDVGMDVGVDGWNEVNIDLNSENRYPSY